jgi:hypothetical protein
MVEDRRLADKVSAMPAVLAFMLTIIVASLTYLLCFVQLPTENNEPLLVLLGVVTAVWKDAMAYWWQDTRSSQVKTKLLANSMPANQRRDEDDNTH